MSLVQPRIRRRFIALLGRGRWVGQPRFDNYDRNELSQGIADRASQTPAVARLRVLRDRCLLREQRRAPASPQRPCDRAAPAQRSMSRRTSFATLARGSAEPRVGPRYPRTAISLTCAFTIRAFMADKCFGDQGGAVAFSRLKSPLPRIRTPASTTPALAFVISAACVGRSESTDRARREPRLVGAAQAPCRALASRAMRERGVQRARSGRPLLCLCRRPGPGRRRH